MSAAPALYEGRLDATAYGVIESLGARASERGWTVPGAALRYVLDAPGAPSLIVAPRSVEQFEAYGFRS